MKCIHIASGDLWAGAEKQIFTLLNSLKSTCSGTYQLIVFNDGQLLQQCKHNKIDVVLIDEKKYGGLKILYRIYRHLLIEKPDIVHTHGFKTNILGAFAAKLSHVPISIRSVHGGIETNIYPWQIQKYVLYLLDTLSARLQQKHVAVSGELIDYVNRRYCKRGIVIENGIDVHETKNKAENQEVELPVNEKIKVGLIGRLNRVKNPRLFVEIQKKLNEDKVDNYIFYIVGDGPLKSEILNLISTSNLQEKVIMTGFISWIEAFINSMDIILITSDHEGLPMVLLEAMALETPVITTAVGGIPQVIGNGMYGTMINDDYLNTFVRKLKDYLDNSETYKKKARLAVDRVNTLYSSNMNASKYHSLYIDLIGQ